MATVSGDMVTVSVGSTLHPMTEEHFIDWVYLQTTQGGQRKNVCRDGKPEVTFALSGGDKPVAVFAYCNLHGLWKSRSLNHENTLRDATDSVFNRS